MRKYYSNKYKNMKTILVPTDFSKCAENAANYALEFADKFNLKVILHNSTHLPTLAVEVPFEEISEEKLLAESKNNMKKYFQNEKIKNKNLIVEDNVSFGFAVDNIISLAKENMTSIIIMGTKGTSNLEGLLLGSITAFVMEKAPCPVLVIPENATFKDIKKIVFATDYHKNDVEAIHFLSTIASKYNAEILVVHESAVTLTDNLERDLFEIFKNEVIQKVSYKNISFKFIVGYDISKDINIILEDEHADLLAISSRKKNIFTKLFEKNLTKIITHHTKIPLIAFHAK